MCKISTKYILVMIAWATLGIFEAFFLFGKYSYINMHPIFTAMLLGMNLTTWPYNIYFYNLQKRLENKIEMYQRREKEAREFDIRHLG